MARVRKGAEAVWISRPIYSALATGRPILLLKYKFVQYFPFNPGREILYILQDILKIIQKLHGNCSKQAHGGTLR
jgi:hypothetical protein